MSHHEWGDKDFDWEGLDAAGRFIVKYCRRAANLIITFKEKYGTLREQVFWSEGGGLSDAEFQYKEYIYGKAHLLAVKKWPHLTQEILEDVECPEAIPGFNQLVRDENKYYPFSGE